MASTWQRGFSSNVWAEIVAASPYSYGSFVTTRSHAPSYCADDEDPCLMRYRASGVEGFEAESKLTYPTLATGVSLSFSLSLSLSRYLSLHTYIHYTYIHTHIHPSTSSLNPAFIQIARTCILLGSSSHKACCRFLAFQVLAGLVASKHYSK